MFIQKKFYKPEFDKIIASPQYGPYVDDLLERAMVRIFESSPDIDPESYIEVQAVQALLEDE